MAAFTAPRIGPWSNMETNFCGGCLLPENNSKGQGQSMAALYWSGIHKVPDSSLKNPATRDAGDERLEHHPVERKSAPEASGKDTGTKLGRPSARMAKTGAARQP